MKQVYRAQPTPDEIEDVLFCGNGQQVGTLNEDGSVHLAFVIFLTRTGGCTETLVGDPQGPQRRATVAVSMIVQGRATTGRSLMVSARRIAAYSTGTDAQRINHLDTAKYIRPNALDEIDSA